MHPSRCSIVVSIPACHAGDPGSIPGNGAPFLLIILGMQVCCSINSSYRSFGVTPVVRLSECAPSFLCTSFFTYALTTGTSRISNGHRKDL
ncbi:hypothetical protein PAHAL_1G048700 [Panicum hallii]|uniref:Uncharacterized protein n=1 Tax=Panicum hallii TaxID=206008 RepID=A0A2T8KU29_9POAL|nr:hypothetical protein PAHAL_1G048700 [Panicum hallii]